MSAEEGLPSVDAARLLATHGPNAITRERTRLPIVLLAGQFANPLVALLAGACVVSALVGDAVDAIAIGAIVIVNALVGFFQEYRAERAVRALAAMTAPRARVRRDGRDVLIAAADVVPGDLLLLEAGDIVGADAHLLAAHRLSTLEAPLTGESTPVEKAIEAPVENAPIAERRDTVFMGTSVANGTGRAVVIATGMRTELGKIAHLLATARDTATPLQHRLAQTSRVLLYVCGAVVALVAVIGLARGVPWADVLLSSVSLAVAAVPEGLPAVVTIALAMGVQRMASRNVLVRRLHAVETLGCATVVCTDKTGTLTTGVMTVRELWGADHRRLLEVAAAGSDAELGADGRSGVGDTTEIALLAAARERGVERAAIERDNPRREEHPFDSDRKRMSILRADGALYVKGAGEMMLPLCSGGTEGALTAIEDMAGRGLRVLAVAIGQSAAEENLHLVGLIGIADPPRTEAIDAVAAARAAGIRTVMITGDHKATAEAIARELGILRDGESPEEVVHARATPEDKLTIVRGWKARGAVVAMTGDGVNDAPALREAHIGIAMGRTGTEVTREASDVVLADDNFASIVAGIREGRGIFENIRKTLVYLLSGNAAELLVMLAASVAGMPFPLLPIHLLWINLVTDGLPALALVTDPPASDLLQRAPRRTDEPMLGSAQWTTIAITGALQATLTLGVFVWALEARGLVEARNLAFSVLVYGELFRSFAARSETLVFFEVGAFTNLRLLGVVTVTVLVQLGIHHIPATQELFEIGAISIEDCALSALLALIPTTLLELAKLAKRAARARFVATSSPQPDSEST